MMMRGKLTIILCMAAVVIGALAIMGFVPPIDFLITVTIGWAFYLVRVIPQIQINWSGVLTAVVSLTLFAFGFHRLMLWFTAHSHAARLNEGGICHWKTGWTLSIVSVIALMFLAGTAAVGITHQAVWLVQSKEPILDGGIQVAANSVIVKNKLTGIGLAFTNHYVTHTRFPYGATYDEFGGMMHGWQTTLLPYLEEESLFQRVRMDLPWNHPLNREPLRTPVHAFVSVYSGLPQGDSDGLALSHFSGNAWILSGDKRWRISDIKDGASNTLLVGEAAGNFIPWGRPGNWRDPALGLNKNAAGFGSPSRDGAVRLLFVDGSVRAISDKADPKVLRAFATPNAGDVIVDDY